MIRLVRCCVFFFMTALLFSCGEGNHVNDNPESVNVDSIIGPEKMVLLMADIHVAEAGLLIERKSDLSSAKPLWMYAQIFHKHHVSQYRYDESLKYYRSNPEQFNKIYEGVIRNLEERQKLAGKK